jgi:hypothetical protein
VIKARLPGECQKNCRILTILPVLRHHSAKLAYNTVTVPLVPFVSCDYETTVLPFRLVRGPDGLRPDWH